MPWINKSYLVLIAHFGTDLASEITEAIRLMVKDLSVQSVVFEEEASSLSVVAVGLVMSNSLRFSFTSQVFSMMLYDNGVRKLEDAIEAMIAACCGITDPTKIPWVKYKTIPSVWEFVVETEAQEEENTNAMAKQFV